MIDVGLGLTRFWWAKFGNLQWARMRSIFWCPWWHLKVVRLTALARESIAAPFHVTGVDQFKKMHRCWLVPTRYSSASGFFTDYSRFFSFLRELSVVLFKSTQKLVAICRNLFKFLGLWKYSMHLLKLILAGNSIKISYQPSFRDWILNQLNQIEFAIIA